MAILMMECPCCGSKYELGRNLDVRKETEADRIRAMTDEELANILTTINNSKEHPRVDWLDWLKQEIEQTPSN